MDGLHSFLQASYIILTDYSMLKSQGSRSSCPKRALAGVCPEVSRVELLWANGKNWSHWFQFRWCSETTLDVYLPPVLSSVVLRLWSSSSVVLRIRHISENICDS